jgi:F-box protein 11
VVCVGADASNFIEGNTIENSKGPGIKIGIANKSSIIRNIITKNFVGIEVIAADPLIFNNTIDKNNSFGVFTRNYEDFNKILRCDGKIKSNLSIAGNKECGIACIGKQNFTRIESN